MTWQERRAGAIALLLAAVVALGVLLPKCEGGGSHPFTRPAAAVTSLCPPGTPPGTTCITGKLLIQDPGSDQPHQFTILDKNGAPMFWVDYGGAGSGGEPFCVYSLRLHPLACLGGAQGSYGGQASVTLYLNGRPVTLTARDLAVLAAWAHAREARR